MEDCFMHSIAVFNGLLVKTNTFFKILPPISRERTIGIKYLFAKTIKSLLISCVIKNVIIPKGSIFGYGALGRAAKRLLPCLKCTVLEPTELWYIAGDGIVVKKPDIACLDSNDLVLVLPFESSISPEF